MKLNDTFENDIMICACCNVEHQMIIRYDSDEKLAYCTIHLKNGNFFQRLRNAVKYLFGHKSIYGEFDEFIFNSSHSDKLIKIGEKIKKHK